MTTTPVTTPGAHRQGWPLPRVRRHRDDRGSATELALLLPITIAVLATLVIGARIALATDRISGVAGIAARDASLARSPQQAQQVAVSSATAALANDNVHCTNIRVDVDTSGFSAAPGTAATIGVRVWCTVDLSDIAVAGLPGAKTLQDSASSPIDPARDLS